jgi:hypothetical protein
MDELQNKLDTGKVEGDFQQQLNDERTRLVAIENRIDELELTPTVKNMQTKIGRGAEAAPGITSGLAPARIDEDTLGINHYFHGHNAKLQVAYSYLHGNAFDGQKVGAKRVWVQSQVML